MRCLTVSGLILLCLSLLACQSKQQQAERALAKRGTPLTAEAFLQSAREGDLEKLQLFLQADMDVNAADANGDTAFCAAVGARQKSAADFLLQHGANIDAQNLAGQTPLLIAVTNGDIEWLHYLLDAGANPNLADHENRTPLTATNDVGILTTLLHAGAQPDERGIQGQPPIVWAVAVKDLEMVNELLDNGANPDTPANSPASNSFVAVVGERTLEYYLIKDRGITPLMVAAGQDNLDMVKLLLERGAKKTLKTGRSATPAIYIACVNHHTSVIQTLLGKDPERQPWRISISLAKQRLTVTRDGKVWLTSPISSGAKNFETPRGEFVVTNKNEEWFSNLYDNAPMPFFMRLNCSPVGLHAGALPGYPASHGCIRLPHANAEKIFQNVDIGTVVTIGD